MKDQDRARQHIVCIAAAFGTVCALFMLFWLLKLAPFGSYSLAREDANIQYLSFFSYLKDVFRGENSLWYSLSIGLGGSGYPLAAYYLFSPFNLLLFLFPKTALHSFVDVTVALKLGLCAWTFCYYLQKRFPGLNTAKVLALSFCFALMQYNIAQSSNLMWLDGIYMLPLILLGVYRIVDERKIGFLAAAFAASLILNWYIAAINALFAFGMLILEWIWNDSGEESLIATVLAFLCAGLRALLLSAWSFLPTVVHLLRGKGSSMDLGELSFGWLGNALDTLRNYRIWSINLPDAVTWFCGGLALLGTVGFLICRKIPARKRISGAAAVLLMDLCYYWIPLFFLFSLGKEPQGHWCRYSYLGSVLLLFLTAEYLHSAEEEKQHKTIFVAAGISVAVLGVLNWNSTHADQMRLLLTLIFLVISALTLILAGSGHKGAKLGALILPLILLLEMGWNASGLMRFYSTDDVEEYRDYVMDQTDRIDAIRASDADVYRIGQTSYRLKEENGLTACYDEAMAYGFASNTGYTSYPDNRQLDFLDSMGYRTEAGSMNIADTSILTADSLLGVRYILSEYAIPGLEPLDTDPGTDSKKIYRNPYAFPMAFTVDRLGMEAEGEDPFQFQNRILREVTGIEEDVFVPAAWTVSEEDGVIRYTLRKSEESSLLYGQLPWEGEKEWVLTAGETEPIGYGGWLSPSVFYIPAGEISATVEIRGEGVQEIREPLFYEMRQEVLQRASSAANEKSADLQKTGNRSFAVSCTADRDCYLYISIPYSEDWTVSVNGEKVSVQSFGADDPMIAIPVKTGENRVEMTYQVRWFWQGVLITIAELLFLCLFLRRKSQRIS